LSKSSPTRVEILRDLRLAKFDVLVGINLLREGLDLPEVSLVAILDADKEGFLRSERSLIQTSGRAARNVNGKVIMYADKITGSMERAINVMDQRREKQREFNVEHGITPKGVTKEIKDIMEGAYSEAPSSVVLNRVAEKMAEYEAMSPAQLGKRIKTLEKQMLEHARNLEFEDAARLRDEIKTLNDGVMGI